MITLIYIHSSEIAWTWQGEYINPCIEQTHGRWFLFEFVCGAMLYMQQNIHFLHICEFIEFFLTMAQHNLPDYCVVVICKPKLNNKKRTVDWVSVLVRLYVVLFLLLAHAVYADTTEDDRRQQTQSPDNRAHDHGSAAKYTRITRKIKLPWIIALQQIVRNNTPHNHGRL